VAEHFKGTQQCNSTLSLWSNSPHFHREQISVKTTKLFYSTLLVGLEKGGLGLLRQTETNRREGRTLRGLEVSQQQKSHNIKKNKPSSIPRQNLQIHLFLLISASTYPFFK